MATYEECREQYCRLMGEELGTKYHLLWNSFASLSTRWDEYVELFGKDQEQFELMNGVAPGFFKSAQDCLWEYILLQLCKFSDPEVVAGKRTLSLRSLVKSPGARGVPNLEVLVDEARARIKFAKDWRDRHIAHADLEHARDSSAEPLAHASRTNVREAMAAVRAVLETVEEHFTGSCLWFGGTSWNWGGTRLISELKFIARLRRERQVRIETGCATADDFDWPKWNES